eukprot:750035-Pyramimonas_sp.AAC.1
MVRLPGSSLGSVPSYRPRAFRPYHTLGLNMDIKPLLSHSTTGEIQFSPLEPLPTAPSRRPYDLRSETLTVIGLTVHRCSKQDPNMDKSWVPDPASRRTEPSLWESGTALLLVTSDHSANHVPPSWTAHLGSLEFRLKETLMPQVDHCICVLRDALRFLFYVSNSELGPCGVSSDHPMYTLIRGPAAEESEAQERAGPTDAREPHEGQARRGDDPAGDAHQRAAAHARPRDH